MVPAECLSCTRYNEYRIGNVQCIAYLIRNFRYIVIENIDRVLPRKMSGVSWIPVYRSPVIRDIPVFDFTNFQLYLEPEYCSVWESFLDTCMREYFIILCVFDIWWFANLGWTFSTDLLIFLSRNQRQHRILWLGVLCGHGRTCYVPDASWLYSAAALDMVDDWVLVFQVAGSLDRKASKSKSYQKWSFHEYPAQSRTGLMLDNATWTCRRTSTLTHRMTGKYLKKNVVHMCFQAVCWIVPRNTRMSLCAY